MQLEKANPKNGFLMAKQGLSKRWNLKDQNWSHFGGEEENVKREEEEEEEEEEKRKFKQDQQGMETTLSMDACLWYGTCDFYMVCMEFLSNCMVRSLLQT